MKNQVLHIRTSPKDTNIHTRITAIGHGCNVKGYSTFLTTVSETKENWDQEPLQFLTY